jgi:hypothetical protein
MIITEFLLSVIYTCWSRWPRSLKSPFSCWNCGFEYRQGHWCLSLMSVVYCHWESLRRTDHSFRRFLPSVVCLSVVSKLRQRGALSSLGLSNHKKRIEKQADKSVYVIICTPIHPTFHVVTFKFAPYIPSFAEADRSEKRVRTGLVFRHWPV